MTAVETHFVRSHGVRLRARLEGRGEPVVVLHGFTGRIEAMEGVRAAIAASRRAIALDLVGHGESDAPADPAQYGMQRCVAQVFGALAALGVGRAHWLGYSMGGRVALSAAAARPDRVRSLVLVGASAGLADPRARAERVREDDALAEHLLAVGLERFVDEWMDRPLFAGESARLSPEERARARAGRLSASPRGLAGSLRGMGTGAMPPLHDVLPDLHLPVLLVVGEEDAKFRGLARSLEAALPDARTAVVPGAGHAAHLENPAAFHAAVRRFLDAVETREPGSRPASTHSPTRPTDEEHPR